MTTQELIQLKEKITTAKETVVGLQGQLKMIKTQLKDDWKCSTIEEAVKKSEKLQKDVDTIDNSIAEKLVELEETYDLSEYE